jgi:hypothetical protein
MVIGHQDKGEDLPPRPNHSALEILKKPRAVGVVPDDLLTSICSGHDMVNRAIEFEP